MAARPGSLINGQHHRTLTDAGLLLARARDRVGRGGLGSSMPRATTLLRLLPVGSALVILCAGLVLVSQGLRVAV